MLGGRRLDFETNVVQEGTKMSDEKPTPATSVEDGIGDTEIDNFFAPPKEVEVAHV